MSPQIIAFLVGASVFFAIIGLTVPKKETPIGGSLARKINAQDKEEEFLLEASTSETAELYDRYFRPMLRAVFPQSPMSRALMGQGKDKTTELLIQSGNPWNLRPEEFRATQFFFGIALGLVGTLLAVMNIAPIVPGPVWVLILAPLGFFFPLSVMRSAREERHATLRKQLPEALDLLVVTMGSGKNLEPALNNIIPRLSDTVLKSELERVAADVAVGKSLESALKSLARRNPTNEIQSFTEAVITSQQNGSDVNETLKNQAGAARSAYKTLLEKKTAKLPDKMMSSLVITMIPAFMLIFIAPTAQMLMTSF